MRPFSRWMPSAATTLPAAETRTTIVGWLILAGLAVVGLAVIAVFVYPPFAIAFAIVVTFAIVVWLAGLVGNYQCDRRLRRLAAQRTGEDIGTFARAFDRRSEPFDPWVVRATWDALQPYVTFHDGRVPLRPTDRLTEDFLIDPEELDLYLGPKIASRAGHTFDHTRGNPWYGRVKTVGDLVRFVSWQPFVSDRHRD